MMPTVWILSANILKKEWNASLVITSRQRILSFTCSFCLFLCSLSNSTLSFPYERSYCFNIRFASLFPLPGMPRPIQALQWWPWVEALVHRVITNMNWFWLVRRLQNQIRDTLGRGSWLQEARVSESCCWVNVSAGCAKEPLSAAALKARVS